MEKIVRVQYIRPPLNPKANGFTLVELMITLTVLGILLAIALPSFRDFILDQKIKNASFELNMSLQYARSEAVKRNDNVSITPVSADWTNGYTITVGTDTLKSVAAQDKIIITGPTVVTFRRDGRVSVGGGSELELSVSPARPEVASRCIRLDASGLPKIEIGAC